MNNSLHRAAAADLSKFVDAQVCGPFVLEMHAKTSWDHCESRLSRGVLFGPGLASIEGLMVRHVWYQQDHADEKNPQAWRPLEIPHIQGHKHHFASEFLKLVQEARRQCEGADVSAEVGFDPAVRPVEISYQEGVFEGFNGNLTSITFIER